MQIDSNNFEEHLDLILKEIESSHFVAFDCEFTGLVTKLQHIQGLFPDHRQFYQRIKQTALNFNLLQLGITLFHYEDGQYFPKSYNFYVSGAGRKGFNKVILAQWDSLAFLARNGMDFGHAFRWGINYSRLQENEQGGVCNPLEQRIYGLQTVFLNPVDQLLLEDIQKNIIYQERMRVDFKSKRIFDYFRNKYDMSFDKPRKNMERYEYDIKVYRREEEGAKEVITKDITKQECIKEVKQEEIKGQVGLQEKEVEVSLGVKKQVHRRGLQAVIQKIISCGKPLVGHFPNLDLGLIYHSFIKRLPSTFQQFSNEVNKLFPFIFDTKVLSRRVQGRLRALKVDLKSLYKACFSKKLLQPYANINYKHVGGYVQADSSHQAGFDSFMTGCACISMLNCLYEHKQGPFVFATAHNDNKLLYSKFAGEISLQGPNYSPRTEDYRGRIVIFPAFKKEHDVRVIGEKLSKRGTLSVYEDHGETYYVFDENQSIEDILTENPQLKGYDQRRLTLSRDLFNQ